MERFNPFASGSAAPDELNPFGSSLTRASDTAISSIGSGGSASSASILSRHQSAAASSRTTDSLGADRRQVGASNPTPASPRTQISPRYTTSFPDPFGDHEASGGDATATPASVGPKREPSARSSSVTFASSVEELPGAAASQSSQRASARGQASGGLSSFLSRATSVTSSSVTDAVGSVRSAVDSISSQIQQAVPSNIINERLSSTATNLIAGSTSQTSAAGADPLVQQDQPQQQQQQQQQSAASYLASKFSSATSTSGQSSAGGSMPVISRQRVVLIIDSPGQTDWAQQFTNYRRQMAGLNPLPSGGQSALSNFFTTATAQLTSSGSSSGGDGGGDLVEQADYRDVSVLANQSSSSAIVLVSASNVASTSGGSSSLLPGGGSRQVSPNARGSSTSSGARIIRPEYVVIRQRSGQVDASGSAPHLRGLVTAFNYCLTPMFEPLEVWSTFQDKQLVFSRLLKIQRSLGKENFPLIPQVFCQTYQDLLNHINSSTVSLPCLIRTGPQGKGRMRANNLYMLKDLASIVAISGLSCTVEPYLEVKCDLLVQRLGTTLKMFRRTNVTPAEQHQLDGIASIISDLNFSPSLERQPASRQTSLGSSVLSSFMLNAANQQQQQSSSGRGSNYERLTEVVNARYRSWVEAVAREFDNKLEAFSLKIVITNSDREYIVGLSDCSMDFLGTQDNQDEDKRNFVELIISQMNTLLPKHSLSREPSANLILAGSGTGNSAGGTMRRSSSDDKAASVGSPGRVAQQEHNSPLGDKKRFISQTQINGVSSAGKGQRGSAARAYGQLSSRSQSVSVNQSDFMDEQPSMVKSSYFTRRGSDRSDSLTTDLNEDGSIRDSTATDSIASGLHQRQASLGQSFLDQTSTAFSSFQKQSLSFFKRLDTRGEISSTPPMSAKSDKAFDRSFTSAAAGANLASMEQQELGGSLRRNDFKSQSVDCSGLSSDPQSALRSRRRETPPKPPPPQPLGSRQSSLASYSSQRVGPPSSMTTPHSTPSPSRQNTTVSEHTTNDGGPDPMSSSQCRKVVRQNSALSAFEPFDPELRAANQASASKESFSLGHPGSSIVDSNGNRQAGNKSLEPVVKRGSQFDSASITSGDSNSTSETTTAEDTMNNLKKTFASIFGDKCE